jgi:hypothetical protein
MKKTQMSPNVKRAMHALKNAPKATGRILNAKEIMDRSLAMTEMAERAERLGYPGKSRGAERARSLEAHRPEFAAV